MLYILPSPQKPRRLYRRNGFIAVEPTFPHLIIDFSAGFPRLSYQDRTKICSRSTAEVQVRWGCPFPTFVGIVEVVEVVGVQLSTAAKARVVRDYACELELPVSINIHPPE